MDEIERQKGCENLAVGITLLAFIAFIIFLFSR